jgi:hypothetical protein
VAEAAAVAEAVAAFIAAAAVREQSAGQAAVGPFAARWVVAWRGGQPAGSPHAGRWAAVSLPVHEATLPCVGQAGTSP